ncbi:MAG: SIS domain-containing protein [Oscillospiraceae bacterium]|nr:SIS domain-containing protein [Oscillospiraceae bacterium]
METPVALNNCLDKNKDTLEALIKDLEDRDIKKIVIAARGTSDHAAVYGKYALELLTGIPVSLASSSIITIYNKKLKLQDTLVIGISQSGKAADVLEVLKNAKNDGAISVGITNFEDSPIAQEAQYHLCCEAGLEKSVAATKTFTTQMFLLGKLAAGWTHNERFENDLRELPVRISSVFTSADEVEKVVPRYRFANDCFVLARGVNYAIAQEAALKIQETCYVRALAYASSDFQHGPIAMITQDVPVIVFAPDGPAIDDSAAIIEKIKASGVEVLIITNNAKVAKLSPVSISIPPMSNDLISPFYNVIIAQMFACKLALLKGLNPDSPRGLNKITITK